MRCSSSRSVLAADVKTAGITGDESMANNDWNLNTSNQDFSADWDLPVTQAQANPQAANINSGFQPESRKIAKVRGPWHWALTLLALLIVGGLSFLMAYLTKDIERRPALLMGLIFAVPMAAMFLASLLLEHRTCAMTPSFLRKTQAVIALAAVVATFGVGTLCDWIYLERYATKSEYRTVFVLDKSSSMGGIGVTNDQKLINAMERVLGGMASTEEVGLVLFGTSVLNHTAIRPLEENNHRANLMRTIKETSPNGMTNFSAALDKAIALIDSHQANHSGNVQYRIIFLTDGEDTEGIAGNIHRITNACKSKQITVHGVAFGAAGTLDTLSTLITTTGGQTVRADDMDQLIEAMVVLTKNDADLLRSGHKDANLMTGIMLCLEGIVIGVGLWLMLSVHGQFRVQAIISPLMGVAALVLLKFSGFTAETESWWIVEGVAFSLLGIVFMTRNRLLRQETRATVPQQKPQESTVSVPDFDF